MIVAVFYVGNVLQQYTYSVYLFVIDYIRVLNIVCVNFYSSWCYVLCCSEFSWFGVHQLCRHRININTNCTSHPNMTYHLLQIDRICAWLQQIKYKKQISMYLKSTTCALVDGRFGQNVYCKCKIKRMRRKWRKRKRKSTEV
jgi:hypothetical protein